MASLPRKDRKGQSLRTIPQLRDSKDNCIFFPLKIIYWMSSRICVFFQGEEIHMGKYTQIDHTADIAISVEGHDEEDLFRTAARAWREAVLADSSNTAVGRKNISLSDDSLDELLVDFLNELNYLLFTRRWIPADFNRIKIVQEKGTYHLDAIVTGEPLDEKRHHIQVEIKAVTYHQMRIERKGNLFKTMVVFDI
jgi:SHS2 domain-containing protein